MTKPIKILITEDNDTIRNGLAMLINATDGMECVATFPNCEDMLLNLSSHDVDVFVMDIELPGISGIEGARRIKERIPSAIILMLTVFENEENIFNALKAGASGYLLKKTPPAQLLEAMKDGHNGGSPMSSNIARKVVRFFQNPPAKKVQNQTLLSKREKEVVASLADGNSYKIIADKLFISTDTVRGHIRNIYKKLHVNTKSGAVAKAIREGIL